MPTATTAPKSSQKRSPRTPTPDAPWHDKRDAMMQDTGRLVIPAFKVKQQLHEMPADYTAVDGMDDRTRHRLIRNGWHWGVASRAQDDAPVAL